MTQGQGTAIFSPEAVGEIRRQWDGKTINVRAWADEYGCSPETIRKIGRRDTYRNAAAASAPVPSRLPQHPMPKAVEPTEEEAAASARRLTEMMRESKEKETSGDRMLDELEKRGGE